MKTNIHTNLLLTVSMIVLLFGCGKDEDTSVKGVSINPSSVVLQTGNSTQLNAVLIPPDASEKSVTWEIDDEKVATISDAGVLTGKEGGAATVTVTSKDGQHKGTRQILVVDDNKDNIFADSIHLNHHELTLWLYDEIQIDVTYFPAVSTDTILTWSMSDGIHLNQSKMLSTNKAGTFYLKATAPLGNVKDSCKVIVKKIDVSGIKFEKEKYTIAIGEKVKLNYTISPENASDKSVTWSYVNDATASFDEETQIVTGLSEGTTNIEVETWDGEYKDMCTIFIVKP